MWNKTRVILFFSWNSLVLTPLVYTQKLIILGKFLFLKLQYFDIMFYFTYYIH